MVPSLLLTKIPRARTGIAGMKTTMRYLVNNSLRIYNISVKMYGFCALGLNYLKWIYHILVQYIFTFLGGISLFKGKKSIFLTLEFFWFSENFVSLNLNDIELQEQSALTQAFGEFLKCLKKICDSSKFDSRPNIDIPDILPWYL